MSDWARARVSLDVADLFCFSVCPRCLWLRARVSSRRWSSSPGNWRCLGQRNKGHFVWTVRLTTQLPLPWAAKVSRWLWADGGPWLGVPHTLIFIGIYLRCSDYSLNLLVCLVKILFLFLIVCVRAHVRAWEHVHSCSWVCIFTHECRCLQRLVLSDSLELELQVVMSHLIRVLGTELGFKAILG